jgi:hypothetical protein
LWYQNADALAAKIAECGSIAATARVTGIKRTTLQRWATRYGIRSEHPNNARTSNQNRSGGVNLEVMFDEAGAQITPDAVRIVTEAHSGRRMTADDVLAEHHVDPAEFELVEYKSRVQGVDGSNEPKKYQVAVTARRKRSASGLIPARPEVFAAPQRRAQRTESERSQLIALVSDQHCPHHDEQLDACWLAWLAENQPDRIVGLGDLVNASKPSRHRPNLHAAFNDTLNECYQAAHDWWRRSLDAAGWCEADQLPGNHDLRLQIATLERLPDAYELRRPGEEHPWWDLEFMLGLDQLGVRVHRAVGEYHAASLRLARGLVVTHGTHAGPVGGAVKAAARHEGSRAQGHDHKQAITYVVRYRDGDAVQHVNVSVGMMARRDLGYVADPDAQQGFATLVIHSDGYWNVELARFDQARGRLVWRDQVFDA